MVTRALIRVDRKHHPRLGAEGREGIPVPNHSTPGGWLEPNFKAIPSQLKILDQWALWRAEPKPREPGKFKKRPRNLEGVAISKTNPSQLSDFDSARKILEEDETFTGPGIALLRNGAPPGVPVLICIDLDHVRNPETDEIALWAAKLIREIDSYTELSPSGTGVHIWAYGEQPPANRNSNLDGIEGQRVEFYGAGAFITVTGHPTGSACHVVDRTGALKRLYARLGDSHPPVSRETGTSAYFGTFGAVELDTLPIGGQIKRLIREGTPVGGRSEALYSVICSLVNAGVDDTTIASVLTDSRYKISEKALEERHGNRMSAAEWLLPQIAKARATSTRAGAYQHTGGHAHQQAREEPPDWITGPEDIGAENEWPEPEPLFTPPECPEFPLDSLPAGIRDAVAEVVDFVQCPLPMAVSSALAHLSLSAQHLIDVRRCDKLVGPVSLYALTVAESGERKTACDKLFGEVIEQWEREQIADYRKEMEAHKGREESWQAKVDGTKSAIRQTRAGKTKRDSAELERELSKLYLHKPIPPQEPALVYGDTTPEALAYDVSCNRPAVGVFSSEAGIVLGSHGMSQSSVMRNLALINTLWESGRCKVRRRTSDSFEIESARLTVCLAAQFGMVTRFMTDTGGLARSSRFSARFLLTKPESTQGTRFFRHPPVSWPWLAVFSNRLRTFLDMPIPLDEREVMRPHVLAMTPEAQAEWIKYHDDVEAELKPGGDMEHARDVASKSADNAARLAAFFHVYERSIDGQIGADSMRRAAEIAAFYLYSGRHVLGELATEASDSDAAKLDAWLLEYCRENGTESITTREISRLGPNPVRKAEARDKALLVLTEAHRVRVVAEGKSKLVKINPALLKRETS